MRNKAMSSLIGLSLLAGAVANAAPGSYKVGDTVKDFALKDTARKTVKLSQFKGKVIVLALSAVY